MIRAQLFLKLSGPFSSGRNSLGFSLFFPSEVLRRSDNLRSLYEEKTLVEEPRKKKRNEATFLTAEYSSF